MKPSPPDPKRSATEPDAQPCLPEPVSTDRLFQGRQEIQIAHGDETYRLRITKNGKLILTK